MTGTAHRFETEAARERWVDAACRGHLTSEQLGEKLGIPSTEAQTIVDGQLRDAIQSIVEDGRDR